jgi:hypothetical protein
MGAKKTGLWAFFGVGGGYPTSPMAFGVFKRVFNRSKSIPGIQAHPKSAALAG